MKIIDKKLKDKITKIKVLAMDVDGVLTNGKINIDSNGKEIKVFDVKDGFSLSVFQKVGYQTAIITARGSEAVTARAKDLKISKVYQNAYPKDNAYQELLQELNLRDENVCFVGDDWPDMVVLKKVGFSVAVNDAVAEVRDVVDYTTEKKGGEGAVREVVELILKTQGQWKQTLESYG